MNNELVIGIGNIYVETNYLGLETVGSDILQSGKEYRALSWETRLGGSVVNFVLQLQKLGFSVGLIGKCGRDEAGRQLIKLLDEKGISPDLISSSPKVQTSVDTGVVFAHNGQNIQLVAGNANQTLSIEDIDITNPIFDQVMAVYLGGFLKQEALYQQYPQLLHSLQVKNIRLFLDHGRIPVDVSDEKLEVLHKSLAYVEGYFPNEEEIIGMTRARSIEEALEKAIKLGPKVIVVKQGKLGCRVKTKTDDFQVSGIDVSVISTVGAGDAFNAGFLSQYLTGQDLRYCANYANTTAAIRVSANEQAHKEEIEQWIRGSKI